MSELMKYMKLYIKTFGEGFPMFQIGSGKSESEVIEIIKRCLGEKKDAYELGYVTDDDDIKY